MEHSSRSVAEVLSLRVVCVIAAGIASMALTQAPSGNPACSVLSAAQVTSLIGAAKTIPISSAPTGSACMWQAGDKVVTILVASPGSAEAATGLFGAKKRIVSGVDIAGWGMPAYAGALQATAAVGILKAQTFIEVKLADPPQTAAAASIKLKAVMKDVASRSVAAPSR
jgi:hypothetical protein